MRRFTRAGKLSMVLALLTSLVLSPLEAHLCRFRIPRMVSSLVLVLIVLAGIWRVVLRGVYAGSGMGGQGA
ncbi:MAG: hypothetical protein V7760_05370 [Marinobacter sp.]